MILYIGYTLFMFLKCIPFIGQISTLLIFASKFSIIFGLQNFKDALNVAKRNKEIKKSKKKQKKLEIKKY